MKTKFLIFGLSVFLTFGLFSCNKTEYMPDPVGEALPYADSLLTVTEYMAEDTEHSLFWRIWRRSSVETALTAMNSDYRFTLFLPDNAAMIAAGYNLNFIIGASQSELDSIAFYHTTAIQLLPAALDSYPRNLTVATMLEKRPRSNLSDAIKYNYMARIEHGELIIKNQVVGLAAESTELKKATVYPINTVLKAPRKSIRQVLVEDGRFTLYLGIRRYNDSLYNALALASDDHFSHIDVPYEKNQYIHGENGYVPILSYLSDMIYVYDQWDDVIIDVENSWYNKAAYNYRWYSTLLAPTDEAFHRAGFNSLQDLIELNNRRLPQRETYYGGQFAGFDGYLPTDSILNHHLWNVNAVPVRVIDEASGRLFYFDSFFRGARVLYSNELDNYTLREIPITNNYAGGGDHLGYNPLDFQGNYHEGLRVRVKGSEYEPATIIERDIETFTGVIHVLDRLLIPPGFKLD